MVSMGAHARDTHRSNNDIGAVMKTSHGGGADNRFDGNRASSLSSLKPYASRSPIFVGRLFDLPRSRIPRRPLEPFLVASDRGVLASTSRRASAASLVVAVLAAVFKKGLGRIPVAPKNLAAHLLHASLKPKSAESSEDVSPQSGSSATETSSYKFPDESDSCDFEEAFSAIHNEVADQPSNQVLSRLDEDRRIKALVDTPAIDWQSQPEEVYYFEGSTGRARGGRMACGIGDGLLGFKKPLVGYVCHRCKMPGHFIQHCPTNGDPKFDIKKMKPATGIPRSMLLATPDGSYSLPDGVAAVLKPNESVFEKEIEGIPSVCRVSDLPPELNCPLCKKVMKDAVMSSKCCFASFCDKCIRDHFITKSMCICGAKHLVADDLIPNVTLREAINSFLVISSRSSSAGSSDMGSATSKALSPVFSVASMSKQKALSRTIFVVFVHQIVMNVVVADR
ncbi:hypothetical protein C4D60_Mb09t22110 [Musa balbisiana]|uniref:Uncharacterized protein n=1 Tax=Musa balbisiana TaxID=52838 RepID=A0A4V4H3F4_MUSBA|nr:hypothetical protein C4D60_Mb09t22110 [Musa balbisiana]